jgi:hypothetical protein
MGGHNQTYLSLRWVGLDDEQILARDTRDWRERRDLKFEDPKTSNLGHRTIVFLARLASLARRLSCRLW